MTTFSRRGLHGHVVDVLGRRIMRGELVSGDIIDPDALLTEFQVSRTVVREAIKVLTTKGLVDARPRLGTYVTPRERWQLLDSDVMTWRSEGVPDPLLVLELSEVRQVLEPAAARLAAVRRSDEQCAEIEAAMVDLAATFENTEVESHVKADLAFHRAILAASGNELLARFEVVLEPALHARDELAFAHETTTQFLDEHRAVVTAIVARDAEAAGTAMKILMDQSNRDSETIVSKDAAGAELVSNRKPAL
ncbi:GntR family transcriptional regulator [Salinibacterium amurskyense]|uniref:GntR family transcriptional regulator n=1 Tax=Salinibacterium amurskyense TaxID=205941 RepID=A0A2M9D570_9MICO|nr:FadR/GntR family transcriptional regulator [Salinibacterium amurskyense]PJJ80849.1 GntR family transcriptional regulator [Salinibacterium amurskyense]RLQ82899.1 FadR family transcriptional regulator [Salinibacterium amurskyense]